jgi:hypothetical protein
MHALVTERDPVTELRAELTARGIVVRVDGTELRFTAPPGALTAELRTAIQTHKHDLLAALTGFVPLDRAILRDTTAKHTSEQIEERLARLTDRAAAPGATPLAHQLVRDWGAIRAAKLAGRDAA